MEPGRNQAELLSETLRQFLSAPAGGTDSCQPVFIRSARMRGLPDFANCIRPPPSRSAWASGIRRGGRQRPSFSWLSSLRYPVDSVPLLSRGVSRSGFDDVRGAGAFLVRDWVFAPPGAGLPRSRPASGGGATLGGSPGGWARGGSRVAVWSDV